jgi:hypothetical protein
LTGNKERIRFKCQGQTVADGFADNGACLSITGGVAVKYFLVSLPIIGVFLGATVFNRVTPFIFGMPLFFAWTLFNVLLMSAIMLAIYKIDPANAKPTGEPR